LSDVAISMKGLTKRFDKGLRLLNSEKVILRAT
jgi:hypothetical protein